MISFVERKGTGDDWEEPEKAVKMEAKVKAKTAPKKKVAVKKPTAIKNSCKKSQKD